MSHNNFFNLPKKPVDKDPIKYVDTKLTKGKILQNVGLIDYMNGSIITGARGEKIINGGVSQCVAIVGRGNLFKSTIKNWMMLTAFNRIMASYSSIISTYDTEINTDISRYKKQAESYEFIPKNPLKTGSVWTITDKSLYAGDEWMVEFRKHATEKLKRKEVEYTAFKDANDDTKVYTNLVPTIGDIDSLSELEPSISEAMVDNSKKYGSDTNMLYTNQGKYKTMLTSDLNRIINKSNIYLFLTAQVGDFADYTGAFEAKTPKALQHMKSTDKIKGVGTKFFFLTTTAFQVHTAKSMRLYDKKEPEYPSKKKGNGSMDELSLVHMAILRSKHGQSSNSIDIIVSQDDGVLVGLTMFNIIKKTGRFGLSGSNISYVADICPDVTLGRRSVRDIIDEDHRVERAINIAFDMTQIELYHPAYAHLLCTPKELYDDLMSMGYNWEELYATRNWQTIDQYSKYLPPFCSTIDLLEFRAGLKKPYWFTKDREKEIKDVNTRSNSNV